MNKSPMMKAKGLKFGDKKLVHGTLGYQFKDLSPEEVLNEYHKILKEAAQRFPTDKIALQFLKRKALSNDDYKIKNSFSLLPP